MQKVAKMNALVNAPKKEQDVFPALQDTKQMVVSKQKNDIKIRYIKERNRIVTLAYTAKLFQDQPHVGYFVKYGAVVFRPTEDEKDVWAKQVQKQAAMQRFQNFPIYFGFRLHDAANLSASDKEDKIVAMIRSQMFSCGVQDKRKE